MVSTLENKTLILKVMLCQARNMIMQNRSEVNIRVSGQQNNDLEVRLPHQACQNLGTENQTILAHTPGKNLLKINRYTSGRKHILNTWHEFWTDTITWHHGNAFPFGLHHLGQTYSATDIINFTTFYTYKSFTIISASTVIKFTEMHITNLTCKCVK